MTIDGTSLHYAIFQVIEWISVVIEVLAIVIIAIAIVYATSLYVLNLRARRSDLDPYHDYKVRLGRALLLGLEILVAADIVRTVALQPTLENVAVLGLLVVVRTFLSWSLVVEVDGHWPWQREQSEPTPPATHKE